MTDFPRGFTVIDNRFPEWGWYTDIPCKVLFLHLIFRANWTDTVLRGVRVRRGQYLTSLRALEKETGLTLKQVRGAVDRLTATGEIATEEALRAQDGAQIGTIYTVVNYAKYQDYGGGGAQGRAHLGHTKGTAGAHIYKDNNQANQETKGRRAPASLPDDWEPDDDLWEWTFKLWGDDMKALGDELLKFRDYWIVQRPTKRADWPGTWRNWIKRTVERRDKWKATA